MSSFATESLKHKLLTKGFWLYFFTFVAAPAGYLTRLIISNSLPVSDVGLLYSVIGLISLIATYNDFGLTESLLYFLPKYWLGKQYDRFKTALVVSLSFQIVTGMVIALLLWFGADWLAVHHFQHPDAVGVLRMFCFYFLGLNIYQVLTSFYGAFQDAFQQKLLLALRAWGILGFTLLFFVFGHLTPMGYARAWVLGLGSAVVLSLGLWWWLYRDVIENGQLTRETSEMKRFWSYAVWIFLGTNATALLYNVDQQMIINMLGALEAGYYTTYLSVIKINSVFVSPLLGFLFPVMSAYLAKGDHDSLARFQQFAYTLLLFVSLVLGGVFVVFGPEAIVAFYGERYRPAGILLQVGGAFLPLLTRQSLHLMFLAGLGKVKKRVLLLGSVVVFNIIANYFLIPVWGTMAAVITTVVGFGVVIVGGELLIRPSFVLRYRVRDLGRNFVGVLLLTLVFLGVKPWIGLETVDNRMWLAVVVCASCVVYMLALLLLNKRYVSLVWHEMRSLKK